MITAAQVDAALEIPASEYIILLRPGVDVTFNTTWLGLVATHVPILEAPGMREADRYRRNAVTVEAASADAFEAELDSDPSVLEYECLVESCIGSALSDLIDKHGEWDWSDGLEHVPSDRVTVVESSGAWWCVYRGTEPDQAWRFATESEARKKMRAITELSQ